MADNPISGHTAGQYDGLRDGDHILSPSLTNIYEGLHGNGILSAHDTAFGDSARNTPASLGGAVSSSAAHQVTIKACTVILDGVPYPIDNGSGGDALVNLTDEGTDGSSFLAGTTAAPLTTGKECLFVILATPLGAKFVQSTIVTAGVGVYPDISGSIADAYLKMSGVSAASNKQSIVLATVRATFNASPADANDLKLTLSEISDKRVFIRPSPFYFSPVTSEDVGDTDAINSHTALEQIHGSGEHGSFGNNGALWQSYGTQLANTVAGDNAKDVLYYSGKHAARFTRSVFDRVLTSAATGATATITITAYTELNAGDKVNLIATDGNNYNFVQGDQSSVEGTFEATTSNNQTATNLMNVINTSSGPSGTRFSATVEGAVVTVTQNTAGSAGNTTVTLTDSGTAGMTKTNFVGSTLTLTSTDANTLILNPGSVGTVITNGSFPAGYIIYIRNLDTSGSVSFALTSSSSSTMVTNYEIAPATFASFVCTTSHATYPIFALLFDDTIDTPQIAANAVTLAKMAGIARGKIIIGDASGNPAVLAAGANGKLLVADANGDPSWTTVSGDVTISAGAVTIAATAVEGSMINDNAISGQGEMTGDVVDTDEILVSDGGILKRADFSVVRDAVFNDVSGDATVAAGGALTIASTAIQDGMLHDDVATGLAGAGTTATSGVLNVIGGDGITANANDVAVTAAQTTITSVTNASLTVGRDAHNLIDFSTDNQIKFKTNNETPVIIMKASGEIEATKFDGALEGNADTATLAGEATILATARAINGVNFDGSAPITITAAGSTLSDTVTVAKGGTGATSLTDGGVLLGSGTGAITAMGVLGDSAMIVGDGTTDPVAESGSTLRTSIGCNPVEGSTSITTVGTIGTGVWNATAIASAKMASASATAQGAVELATSAETNTGTDATRAVTPDGLEDWEGSAQVTTLGTIATGVWQGTAIAEAYLPNASATAEGVVELATSAETITGTDAARVVTPDGLADWTGGNSAVTKLGTIATGVWAATDVAVAHGGTGVSTLGANAVLTGDGTNAIASSTNLTFNATTLAVTGNQTITPANDVAAAALTITNADTDQIALDINAANIDAHVIDITADALTTGSVLNIVSNSASTATRNLVHIHNDHADASGTTAFKVTNDHANEDGAGPPVAHLVHAGLGDTLRLEAINDANNTAPDLVFKKTTSNGNAASGELIGNIDWLGVNAGNAEHRYANMYCRINNPADGAEYGELKIETMVAGTTRERITFEGVRTAINSEGINMDTVIHGLTNDNLLYVDAQKDSVGFGQVSPDANAFVYSGSAIGLAEISAPNATGDYGKIWTQSTNELYFQDGDGANQVIQKSGKQTMWIPAAAMSPTVSNGCSALTHVETTAGRPDMVVLDFDKDSDEFAQFSVAFPKSWNLGTVTFQVFWSGIAATTDCDWQLQGVAMNDNETIDVAYGTAVVVTDNAQGAVEELLVSAESGAVTIAGTPADNDLCYFRVGRDVSGDAMAGDARLHGIKILYTTDAGNDV